MPPVAAENELDDLIYAGADKYEDEADLSGLDRGDALETPKPEREPEPEPDAEVESDAEGEPEAEPEADPTPEALRADHRIPKQRFDEVNERRKAAERRAQELERQLAMRDPQRVSKFDFDAKEEQYAQLVLDGDLEKAKVIRREIRAAEQAAFEALADERAHRAREMTKAEMTFQQTVSRLNSTFPMFDPEQPEIYNKDLVDEALELHAGFMNRGYAPADAIERAVYYVAAARGLQPASSDVAPTPVKAPVKKPDIQKKLDAAAKQPPKQAGRGMREEADVDFSSLSEEEFDALPESKIRALRGDARF
jgi:hypothetical protein